MKHLRLLILTIGLCACYGKINAQNGLTVLSKTKDCVSFQFADKPILTYRDTVMVITTERTVVEYPLGDVEKVLFTDVEAGVQRISADITNEDGLFIYDMGGKLVKKMEGKDGDLELLLDNLQEGIYTVKGKVNFKIFKR